MKNNYDVIIIGAGSVGVPTALFLSKKKYKVLIIDKHSSVGQGQNKKAIGGIRATHSVYGKIKVAQKSIEIFSTWKEKYGDEIGWIKNGYSFPAYTEKDEKNLKELLKIQQSYGLNINWISKEEYLDLVPGINSKNLRGSTYSPDDGSASPMMSIAAFWRKSEEWGAKYQFNETVKDIVYQNEIFTIKTDKQNYQSKYLINAAGAFAKEIGKMLNVDLPVQPDSHEAAITEPVKRFFEPMVVDIRPSEDSANFYFYQNNEGQVIFCITPNPPIYGTDSDSTSKFLPQIAKRMLALYPRLKNLKVRRAWRGQYPMTPDGIPIIGKDKNIPNFINAVGMCGQGFMLGPGIGDLIARMVDDNLSDDDKKVLKTFDPDRSFEAVEKFK